MLHWKTKEQMGEGFAFNEKDHEINEYNSLVSPYPFEKNIMRTKYLIRDIWDLEQLQSLREFLEEEISNRETDSEYDLDLEILQ